MQHLFTDKSLPFYKFGDVIYLTKIPTREWVSFIVSRFQNSGKNITPEQAQTICQTVDNHFLRPTTLMARVVRYHHCGYATDY